MNSIYQLKQNIVGWKNVKYIKPSTYCLLGMDIACDYLTQKFHNDHLICIYYKQGDTQIGLTETGKKWENNFDDIMIRGLSEELNISIRGIENKHEIVLKKKKKNIKIYCLHIDVNTNINIVENINYTTNDDDKTKKVLILLHGNKNTIMTKISKIKSSEKDIIGINLIPIKKIKYIWKNN